MVTLLCGTVIATVISSTMQAQGTMIIFVPQIMIFNEHWLVGKLIIFGQV
jgi:hypothetical protein